MSDSRIVEIIKEFRFEAAHFLPRVPEDHKCRRMHGHSFRFEIKLVGPVSANSGWLMDFGDISRAVRPVVDSSLDHRLLNEVEGLENPTSEEIAIWLWKRLKPSIPLLQEITVHERATHAAFIGDDVKALVLLSGGLDSATTLLQAVQDGFETSAASFHYGQRHSIELERARVLAEKYCKRHFVLRLDPVLFQNTALVEGGPAVPGGRAIDDSIPVTYVPARNILFLSHALALAESHGFDHIFIGVNALDYSGYPDCRPEFIEAFERMAALGMKRGVEGNPVRIEAPLLRLGKADIVRLGARLGLDFRLTSSCYSPGPAGQPCRVCDSCQLRALGFKDAGLNDPLFDPD